MGGVQRPNLCALKTLGKSQHFVARLLHLCLLDSRHFLHAGRSPSVQPVDVDLDLPGIAHLPRPHGLSRL